jgi:methionine-rich copper-binding protein CopC
MFTLTRRRRGVVRRRLSPAMVLAVMLGVITPWTLASGGTADAVSCPCSIWSSSATPTTPSESDFSAVELGVKFQSDVDGTVAGIRFYKGSGNTGSHVGHLWSRSGTLLASATFSSETSTGWQQVLFSNPVAITAGTTYVASYYAPSGHYAGDNNGLASPVDNAPLHALADGQDGGNGVYRYGTGGGFPANTYQASNYWVDVVFTTTATDTTPPTVTSTSPAANATGVPNTTTVSATFSEPVQPATVTFSLKNPAGTTVVASQSYDSASRTATLTPSSALADSTQYTASVSGAQDAAGNTLAQPVTWTFTTASAAACPCSLWPSSAAPATANVADGSAVELGVKFRSSSSGSITGIRFYKGSQNTGTHIGSLWSSAGTRLATATFSGESTSGWQQVLFSAPVAISANTTYVASYHTNVGFYSATSSGLASAVTNGPLTAPASGSSGGNGVYLYGGGGFPTNTFQATNYWVDVVFSTSATDTTPPTVVGTTPAAGAGGVSTNTTISATFSEDVQPSSIAFTVTGAGGAAVPGTVSYSSTTLTATFRPSATLANSASYTATISGATDLAGNVMAGRTSWTFSTAAPPPPPPTQGPGGPVLVIANNASTTSQFSLFTAEILRNEGLNEFSTANLSTVTASTLAGYDVVILGQTPLTAAQVSMFGTWVNGGGRLIAFRPDAQLASLLGLTPATGTVSDGYVKVDTTRAPGAGLTDQTIQFHGTADRYTLTGATAVATLYSTATTATTNPGVTLATVGTSGGKAAAFTYDLPRSIVAMRQGNAAWAGQERDGQAPIRSDDLYFGGRNATDWVNLSKAAIPQADEQQRLLANLIGMMDLDRKPLPRFWYFPRSTKAVVVATGDDHGNGGTAGRFDQYAANSPANCSTSDWTCLRFSSYMFPSTPLTDSQASGYRSAGFEMGVHPQNGCTDFTASSLENDYATQLSQFAQSWPSLSSPVTNRYHCIVYSDWASQPKTELRHGIRLDTNYYYWPGSWLNDRPGFMTGSGMPMRFADTDGTLLDIYQAATQMTDESGQSYPATPDTLLDNALGSLGYYGAFTANMHTDQATTFEDDQLLASASSRGVPIISAAQLLTWLDGRNGSSFGNLSWSGNTLLFSVAVGSGANGLTGMIPTVAAGGATLTGLTRSGTAVPFTRMTVKGVEYAFFSATAGSYTATYGASTAASNATTLTASTMTSGNAIVRWSTDQATTSRVVYGDSASSLTSTTTDAVQTRSHEVALAGLDRNRRYYYRVVSKDPRGRTTTTPAPTQAPAVLTVGTPDTTAPRLSAVNAEPLPDGTATLTWNSNEVADSTVLWGTSADRLDEAGYGAGPDSTHAVVLSGLRPDTTYHYRVVSVDPAGNRTIWPAIGEQPATFVSAGYGVADHTVAQLRVGSRAGTYLSEDGFGEVRLAPDSGEEFGTTALPSSYEAQSQAAGGSLRVSGGQLSLDGRRVVLRRSLGTGQSLSFSAMFNAGSGQTVGWQSADGRTGAGFTTQGGHLYAATTGPAGTMLHGLDGLIGTAHSYRIDRSGRGVSYWVDGKLVARNASVGGSLRTIASDDRTDGIPLSVDWMRVGTYVSTGRFTSRVLSSDQMVTWDRAYWAAQLPAGTTVTVRVRLGSTPKPDSTWSGWQTLPGPGSRIVGSSRFLQYELVLTSRVAGSSPVVSALGFTNSGQLMAAERETGR